MCSGDRSPRIRHRHCYTSSASFAWMFTSEGHRFARATLCARRVVGERQTTISIKHRQGGPIAGYLGPSERANAGSEFPSLAYR